MPELRVLGPVELWTAGRRLGAGPRKQQAVLVALAVDAGRPVPTEVLIDRVWDDAPRQVRGAVHTYVTRLRRLLEQAAPGDRAWAELAYRDGGYLLRVDRERVDLHRFRRLVTDGRHPERDDEQRAVLLRQALALWRGHPLSGLSGEWIDQVRESLVQQRLAAVLALMPIELRLGRAGAIVDDLHALTKEFPLIEPLAGLLMRALHACGRSAEALDCFAGLRRRLVEELGTEPGAELRQVHQAILRGDLDEPPAPRAHRARTGMLAVPAQLPPAVPGFTGRDGPLAELDTLADSTRQQPTGVVIAVLSGTAGVGKTALAVHWAHRSRHRFPDGQLYVNLRGFDPTGTAVGPAEAVRGFLDALQVPAHKIPGNLDGQVALYRGLLADKRVLILLDNARDAAQVRPLLPGSPGCLVLVTSRDQLVGLLAAEGATSLPLDLLTMAEARQLLAQRLGRDRTATYQSAVDDLITQCARLPLALVVAAAHAAAAPTVPLGVLAGELRATHSALDAFANSDATTDIRTVFSLSCRALRPAAARLFRLLGLHPGPDIGTAAVASLAGAPVSAVRPLLAELCRAHLVTEHVRGRFSMHDLLRTYAGELAGTLDTDAGHRAATRRVLDHYLHAARAAGVMLNPHRFRPDLPPPAPDVTVERPADYQQALAWLTQEHAVLLAVVGYAARGGHDTHAWMLARLLGGYFDRRAHWQHWADTQLAVIHAGQRLGDRAVQAEGHRGLGRAYARLGRDAQARRHYRYALALFVELGDRVGQARTQINLALGYERHGRYRDMLRHARRAVDLLENAGDRATEANALNTVGWCHALLGEYARAVAYCRQAIALHREVGDRDGEAATWDSLGYAHHHLGQYEQAARSFHRALEMFRELGDPYEEAITLSHLGDTHHARGRVQAAHDAWRQALTLLEDLDHPAAADVRAKFAMATVG